MIAYAAIAALAASALEPTGFRLEYQFNLATPAGEIRTSAARLSYDPAARELYVFGYGLVRIFNEAGMETFRFGDDEDLGVVQAAAALESGELVALFANESGFRLERCTFRGEPLEPIELKGVPEAIAAGFQPSAIAYAQGRLYLADLNGMRVVLAAPSGAYLASFDLAEMLSVGGKRQDIGLSGFGVAPDGSLLFTVAPLFKAYLVTLKGELRFFGQPGGGPGKFGITSGIGADAEGRIYVADQLKGVVLVFDHDFKFLGEFGALGAARGRLVSPTSIAVGPRSVFVSQYGDRGVSVFQVRE
jgi:hypothetical protein